MVRQVKQLTRQKGEPRRSNISVSTIENGKRLTSLNTTQRLRDIFVRKPRQVSSSVKRTGARVQPVRNVSFQATSTPSNSVIIESLEAKKVDEVQRLIEEKKPVFLGSGKPSLQKRSAKARMQSSRINGTSESMRGALLTYANNEDNVNISSSKNTFSIGKKDVSAGSHITHSRPAISLYDPIDLLRDRKYILLAKRIR